MDDAKVGKVKHVEVQGRTSLVTSNEGNKYPIILPSDIWVVGDLMKYGIQVTGKTGEEQGVLLTALYYLGPTLLIIMSWFYMMRQVQDDRKGDAFLSDKSRARLIDENNNSVTFADMAGCNESKEEVVELVDFLKDPQKFQKLGERIPRGMLLVRFPGTGKTLLARAIAGGAKVPFFSIPGSDFAEMFIGVGAARVRDMFENAKKQMSCIVFADEADAVGRHRGASTGGGNDEREQALNRMLVEMDGLEVNSGVIIIAATNRVGMLDKALLRPGRFDRQVYVGLPGTRGRKQILEVHMRKASIGNDADASMLARSTPGFLGADLANLVSEAVLFATRRNKRVVDMQDFEDVKDKIYMGPERKSAMIREEECRAMAYHESGYAVVAKLPPEVDSVHKVTIMLRGWAGGLIRQLLGHNKYYARKDTVLEEVAILSGGRATEGVFLGVMSTDASNDLKCATKMARDMVARYGISDTSSTMIYTDTEQDGFFGHIASKTMSEATQQKADPGIHRIVDEQYALAKGLLKTNHDKVEAMTAALLGWETIDADQVNDIMDGKPPRPPHHGSTNGSSTPLGGNTPAGVNPDNVPVAA